MSTVQAPPMSVVPFGAKGNGVADDTAALQAAIDYVVANPGRFSGVQLMRRHKVTSPLVIPPSEGFNLYGFGGADYGLSSAFVGTEIVAHNMSNLTVLLLDAAYRFRIRDLRIRGSNVNSLSGAAKHGIRLVNRANVASGVGIVENVNVEWCVNGFSAGTVESGESSFTQTNSDTVTFTKFSAYHCTNGFATGHEQAVHFTFVDCHFNFCENAFNLPSGGGVLALHPALYDTQTLLRAGAGGPNINANVVVGAKIDGTAYRTALYVATNAGGLARARFIDPHCNNGQPAGSARVQLKDNNEVILEGGDNLCGAGGKLVSFDSGGTFLARGARIDAANAKGTGTETAYRLRDCIASDGTFVADVD